MAAPCSPSRSARPPGRSALPSSRKATSGSQHWAVCLSSMPGPSHPSLDPSMHPHGASDKRSGSCPGSSMKTRVVGTQQISVRSVLESVLKSAFFSHLSSTTLTAGMLCASRGAAGPSYAFSFNLATISKAAIVILPNLLTRKLSINLLKISPHQVPGTPDSLPFLC